MTEPSTNVDKSSRVGSTIDREKLIARRHEAQREKRTAQRIVADRDREIGEIDRQLRRAPNAGA